MQLFIRNDTGATTTVTVEPETLIKHVMELLDDQDTFLQYGGKPLQSTRTIQDYNVNNHATLSASHRLRGGCFSISITLWMIIFTCVLISVCTCGLSLPIALMLLPFALLLPLCCL